MSFLARIILKKGLIEKKQLNKVILQQIITGKRLGRILIENKILEEEILGNALADRYGIPNVPSSVYKTDIPPVYPELMNNFPIFPFKLSGKTLHTAFLDPSDRATTAKLTYKTGKIIKPYVIPEAVLLKIYEKNNITVPEKLFYPTELTEKIDSIPHAAEKLKTVKYPKEVRDILIGAAELIIGSPLLFILYNNRLELWGGRGLQINTKKSKLFSPVVDGGGFYIGKPQVGEDDKNIYNYLGKQKTPSTIYLFPIVLKNRTVNILYGERKRGREKGVGELINLTQQVPVVYEKLLKEKWKKIKK